MKTRTIVPVSLCALGCLAAPTMAQITITASDVSAQLTAGYILVNNSDTLTVSANIGAPGSTSWDFSGLGTHSTFALTSVPVSSTPYAADFPAATHALQTPVVVAGITGTGYQFLTLGTHLLNPGNKAGASLGILGFGTLTTTNAPIDTTYALPSTFGSGWNSAYTATQVIAVNGIPIQTTVTTHAISYSVDAYGPLTMPGGETVDALRIRRVEDAGTKTVGYIFIAKNGASVQLTAADTSQPHSGVIALAPKSVTWSPPNPALPVQISSFTAAMDGSGTRAILRWTTVSELNNFGFEVQSGAGRSGEFQTVADGFVPGHGTTLNPQHYSWTGRPPAPGSWYYRLNQVDLDGSTHPTEAVRLDMTTDASESPLPARLSLMQNYPNPFNPTTTLRYSLPEWSHVRLALYNPLGELVATLADEVRSPGEHSVIFNGTDIASGAYYCRMEAGGFRATVVLLLVR